MRKLVYLGVFIALLGVLDVGARMWAEGEIEARARAELASSVRVSAGIDAFPFVPPLLATGRVAAASAKLQNVRAGTVVFATVEIELHGVRVSRDALLSDRRVELTDIREGTIAVELSADALSDVVGADVRVRGGEVLVAGQTLPASVRVADNAVSIDAGIISRRVAIPKTSLIPCVGGDVTVLAGRVRFVCTIRDIPPGLFRRFER